MIQNMELKDNLIMPPKKNSSNSISQQVEILQDPMQYGFWKRLPYTLTEE